MTGADREDHLPDAVDLAALDELQRRGAVEGVVGLLHPCRDVFGVHDLVESLAEAFDLVQATVRFRPGVSRLRFELAQLSRGDAEEAGHLRLLQAELVAHNLDAGGRARGLPNRGGSGRPLCAGLAGGIGGLARLGLGLAGSLRSGHRGASP